MTYLQQFAHSTHSKGLCQPKWDNDNIFIFCKTPLLSPLFCQRKRIVSHVNWNRIFGVKEGDNQPSININLVEILFRCVAMPLCGSPLCGLVWMVFIPIKPPPTAQYPTHTTRNQRPDNIGGVPDVGSVWSIGSLPLRQRTYYTPLPIMVIHLPLLIHVSLIHPPTHHYSHHITCFTLISMKSR